MLRYASLDSQTHESKTLPVGSIFIIAQGCPLDKSNEFTGIIAIRQRFIVPTLDEMRRNFCDNRTSGLPAIDSTHTENRNSAPSTLIHGFHVKLHPLQTS